MVALTAREKPTNSNRNAPASAGFNNGATMCAKVYCQLAPCTRELSSSSRPSCTITPDISRTPSGRPVVSMTITSSTSVPYSGTGSVMYAHSMPSPATMPGIAQGSQLMTSSARRPTYCVRVVMYATIVHSSTVTAAAAPHTMNVLTRPRHSVRSLRIAR